MGEKSAGYKDFICEMEQRGLNSKWLNTGNFLYGDYVEYLSGLGWNREFIALNEYNMSFVDVRSVNKDNTGYFVDIVCPSGCKMSIMGKKQTPDGHTTLAYSLGLHITKENGEEIPDSTKIRITKEKSCEFVIQLARVFYCDIKMMNREAIYTLNQGIEINGDTHLRMFVVNPECDISSAYVDFKIEMDFWNNDLNSKQIQ
jgi:hypothetical protein